MPGVLARVKNLARAAAGHAADGLAEVSDDEYASRLTTCEGCALRRPEDWVCQHPTCGCFLTIKAKWRSETCPLGKWELPVVSAAPQPSPTGNQKCVPCAAARAASEAGNQPVQPAPVDLDQQPPNGQVGQ
jgi:hypothetical protein